MSARLLLYALTFIALGATLVTPRRARFLATAVAAAAGLLFGYEALGPLGALFPLLVLILALAQLAAGTLRNRRARLTAEEQQVIAGPFAGLSKSQARRLLDQGVWVDADAGDVLVREGATPEQLYFLARGRAEVRSAGVHVGECHAGQLIGESAVLADDPASATVTLVEPARLWCAPATALAAWLAANEEARHVLEHGVTIALRDKLEAMNRAAAGG